jgi:hypothetical protein
MRERTGQAELCFGSDESSPAPAFVRRSKGRNWDAENRICGGPEALPVLWARQVLSGGEEPGLPCSTHQ